MTSLLNSPAKDENTKRKHEDMPSSAKKQKISKENSELKVAVKNIPKDIIPMKKIRNEEDKKKSKSKQNVDKAKGKELKNNSNKTKEKRSDSSNKTREKTETKATREENENVICTYDTNNSNKTRERTNETKTTKKNEGGVCTYDTNNSNKTREKTDETKTTEEKNESVSCIYDNAEDLLDGKKNNSTVASTENLQEEKQNEKSTVEEKKSETSALPVNLTEEKRIDNQVLLTPTLLPNIENQQHLFTPPTPLNMLGIGDLNNFCPQPVPLKPEQQQQQQQYHLLEQSLPFGHAPNINCEFNLRECILKNFFSQQLMYEQQIENLKKDFNFNMNLLYGEVKKLQKDVLTLATKQL